MYDIVFDEKAIEFLEKIEKNTRKRIYNKIISTKENPFHYFERLTGKMNINLELAIIELSLTLMKKQKTSPFL